MFRKTFVLLVVLTVLAAASCSRTHSSQTLARRTLLGEDRPLEPSSDLHDEDEEELGHHHEHEEEEKESGHQHEHEEDEEEHHVEEDHPEHHDGEEGHLEHLHSEHETPQEHILELWGESGEIVEEELAHMFMKLRFVMGLRCSLGFIWLRGFWSRQNSLLYGEGNCCRFGFGVLA